jgi:hypothetical protein
VTEAERKRPDAGVDDLGDSRTSEEPHIGQTMPRAHTVIVFERMKHVEDPDRVVPIELSPRTGHTRETSKPRLPPTSLVAIDTAAGANSNREAPNRRDRLRFLHRPLSGA